MGKADTSLTQPNELQGNLSLAVAVRAFVQSHWLRHILKTYRAFHFSFERVVVERTCSLLLVSSVWLVYVDISPSQHDIFLFV